MLRSLLLSCAIILCGAEFARACDNFQELSTEELKDFRNKLVQADADPFDRVFAYQQLSCSNSPVIRAFAIKAGLENAVDQILRNQIAFDAVMQMERVDLLISDEGLSKEGKRLVQKRAGVISKIVKFRDHENGCLSLNQSSYCGPRSVRVKGSKLTYQINGISGTLTLAESNEFIGYVVYEGGRIPAKIELF